MNETLLLARIFKKISSLIDENFDKAKQLVSKAVEKADKSITATNKRIDDIQLQKGDKGDKGDPGKDGQDGYTPIKGKDYFDGKDGVDGKDGKSVKGDKGDKGDPGKDGKSIKGEPGADGKSSEWFAEKGKPGSDEGEDGDLWLNSTNGDVYKKEDGDWKKVANIKGSKGEKGADGRNGSGGGSSVFSRFTSLLDTPSSYVGQSGKFLRVKATEDGIEFIASSGGSISWGEILGDIEDQEDLIALFALKADASALSSHTGNTNNPHATTKSQVGLGNVDNTSDAAKPVSTATQTALDLKVDKNTPITGATKTKITYDSKGLVTGGADATTADIAEAADKNYVTDADLATLGNTSGVNTGDQDLSGLQPLNDNLTGLSEISSDGFVVQIAPNTFSSRQISSGDNSIIVENNNGVADDPTIAVTPGEKRVYFFEDFVATQLLVAATSGTAGAVNSASATAGDATHPGIFTSNTGTDAAGRATLQFQNNAFRFGGGTYIIETLSQIPTLSDGTDIFTVRIGFGDVSNGESADAAFFRYTHSVNSGKFQAVTRSNNVETGSATDTGVTAAAGTWYKFKIEVAADGSGVDFYIDDTYVATNTTNIPLGAGRETGGIFSIIKGGGTAARTLLHDWIKLEIMLTTSR
jgi:hypothetical protein